MSKDNRVNLGGNWLTSEQAECERAYRTVDQVLMRGLASGIWIGTPDRQAFDVLNNLTGENVDNCVNELFKLGLRGDSEAIRQELAFGWAERFAFYWPEEDERIRKVADQFAGKVRS